MNLLARLQFNHARCLFFASLFRRIPIWPSFKQVSNIEAQASAVNDYSKVLKSSLVAPEHLIRSFLFLDC